MSTGEVTPLHEGWRYKTLSGSGNKLTGVSTAYNACGIIVPFDHILRRAWYGFQIFTLVGTTTIVGLQRGLVGATAVSVGTFTNLTATNANFLIEEATLLAAAAGDISGPAMYNLNFNIDNTGDIIESPSLSIMVSPIPPGPA